MNSINQICLVFCGFILMKQLGFIYIDECFNNIFEEIKTGENATFKITGTEAYYNAIWVYREKDGNNITIMVVNPHKDTYYPNKTNYENRTFLSRTENGVSITLTNLKSSDGGPYYIKYSLKWYCYTIHVSGPPCTPVITAMGTYSGLEEHNHVRFTCSSHSTSFPGRDIFISWKINGTEVQKMGDDRFQVVDVDFWIHNVLRQDNGSDVLCEATDDNGKTIVSSETLKIVVYWGPDIVSLKPTNMVYHVARGTKINPITASADCNPPCFYTWRKRGKNESLSTNATLKIEVASEDTEGEYIFSATRNGTTKTTSIVILLDKDTHGPRNTALTVCLSVVLVLAVLLAAVGIFYLYKHGYFGQCRAAYLVYYIAKFQAGRIQGLDFGASPSPPGTMHGSIYYKDREAHKIKSPNFFKPSMKDFTGTDIPHNDARGSSENYYEPLELRTVQATNSLDIRDPPFQSSTYENDDMSEGSPLTDDNIYEEMGEDEEDSNSTSSMETEL